MIQKNIFILVLSICISLLNFSAVAQKTKTHPVAENCKVFNPEDLELLKKQHTWIVTDGSGFYIQFGHKADAFRVLQKIKKTGINQSCKIGTSDKYYLKKDGRIFSGSVTDWGLNSYHCNNINASELKVLNIGGGAAENIYLLAKSYRNNRVTGQVSAYFSNKNNANKFLNILQFYNSSEVCLVNGAFEPKYFVFNKN